MSIKQGLRVVSYELSQVSHYGARGVPPVRYNAVCFSIGLTTYLRVFLHNSDSTSEFYACELGGVHRFLVHCGFVQRCRRCRKIPQHENTRKYQ
jgi:hypothetical protein